MKTGDLFYVDNDDLLRPMIGRVLTLEVDGQPVTAKIYSVAYDNTVLKVVPDGTKE